MTQKVALYGVTLEDGVAVRHGGKSVVWVQCPSCGPQAPVIKDGGAITHTDGTIFSDIRLTCPKCDQDAPYRESRVPLKAGHGKCGRRCWDGKRFCSCVCQGKCHGQGRCLCEEP